jgi:flavin reductase ActVB
VNAAAFREALSRFASGVTVVTARLLSAEGDRVVGFTATSFASVSLSPPLILVCVSHTASAYDAFVRAETFGVSVLGERQSSIADQFARKGIDRFAGAPLSESSGPPLIEGALVQLECRRFARHEAGDHTVVLGEVTAAHLTQGKPLVYFGRRFAALAIEADVAAPPPLGAGEGGEA